MKTSSLILHRSGIHIVLEVKQNEQTKSEDMLSEKVDCSLLQI